MPKGAFGLAIAAALSLQAAPAAARSFPGPILVFFDPGSARLTPYAMTLLDAAVAFYEDVGAREILVEGAADRLGSAAANMRLSCRRARVIADYLVRRGVEADGLVLWGYGETAPIVETADGVAEPQNRFGLTYLIARGRDRWLRDSGPAIRCPRRGPRA